MLCSVSLSNVLLLTIMYFKKIIQFISLGNRVATIWGKKLQALLAICSFCGCLIVFVCLYLGVGG